MCVSSPRLVAWRMSECQTSPAPVLCHAPSLFTWSQLTHWLPQFRWQAGESESETGGGSLFFPLRTCAEAHTAFIYILWLRGEENSPCSGDPCIQLSRVMLTTAWEGFVFETALGPSAACLSVYRIKSSTWTSFSKPIPKTFPASVPAHSQPCSSLPPPSLTSWPPCLCSTPYGASLTCHHRRSSPCSTFRSCSSHSLSSEAFLATHPLSHPSFSELSIYLLLLCSLHFPFYNIIFHDSICIFLMYLVSWEKILCHFVSHSAFCISINIVFLMYVINHYICELIHAWTVSWLNESKLLS